MQEKLKSWLADDAFFLAVLILLIGVVSFGLGRQSVLGQGVDRPAPTAPAGVLFTDVPTTTKEAYISTKPTAVSVVGSRSGTKYHLPHCPGAQQIKEENKVYFDSIEQAQAAGYTPAANCPELQ